MTEAAGPRANVHPVGVAQPLGNHRWRVTWNLLLLGPGPLEIHEGWLPHGRFRAETRIFDPPLRIETGGLAELSFDVTCDDEPGTRIENGFILLRTAWQGAHWRLFVRLLVEIDEDGVPRAVTELVTPQPIRFEG